MPETAPPMHRVCTLDQAKELIDGRTEFWIADCGCRKGRGACARSRMDVCLFFVPSFGDHAALRPVSRDFVNGLLAEAKEKDLVTRPFRHDTEWTQTAGVCFCCDDCCGYFLNRSEACGQGSLIERTDRETCSDCGACVELCHFGARTMVEEKLVVDSAACYGCGVCVPACPLESITMVARG